MLQSLSGLVSQRWHQCPRRQGYRGVCPGLFLAIIAWLAAAPATRAQGAGRFQSLESTVSDVLRTTGTPGAVVTVVQGNRMVYSKAFGVANVETGAPMTTDLLFQLGSLTKPFTAALVLALAYDATVDLHAPLARYVSGFAPRIGRVSLEHLLTQTSGLKDVPGDYGLHDESALLAYARSWTDAFAPLGPGEAFSYSNLGFALAGLVAQEASGKLYAELMRERVLTPLGMSRATFRPTEAMTWPRAAGHDGKPGETPAVVRPIADDTRLWPAGYLYASAGEIARFMIALLNRGAVDGRQVLPATLVDSALAPHVAVPGLPNHTRYGYGFFIDSLRGHRSVWHAGSLPGYSSLVRLLPVHRVGVIVLANKDLVRLDRIAEEALADAVRPLGVVFTPMPPTDPDPPTVLSPAELRRYQGRYENRWPIELRERGGVLYLRRFDIELPVTPLGAGRFTARAPGASQADVLTVVPPQRGRPGYVQMFMWAFPRVTR